ncbi:MAG: response regulator transcription factor [Lachnospiraceae bacterium]|nr:response regulator transcription factor [Lachnospiraceae bacterium]
MADKQRILVVDDDESIAELITLYLTKECYSTEIAADGEEALEKFKSFEPNLVLLDIMLPGIDGYEVCREIRKTSNVPIIMLSAKGEVFDKVLGLELGADDYIMKPFDSKELVARCKAVLRRFADGGNMKPKNVQSVAAPNSDSGEFVQFDGLAINHSNYTVVYNGKKLEMPPKELELLYYLASNPNRVFTREQLLDKIWGYEYPGDTRTVDVHVKRLREKIKDGINWKLSTVWGVGYKFEVD